MKSVLAGIALTVAIAAIAWFALQSQKTPSSEAFTSPNVSLGND